jgi:hypothetical protein
MMTSVIPARLDFQCGHAALVSLPRVKGESSAQRSIRIALEKSGAQARSCDFCAPRQDLAHEIVAADAVALAAATRAVDAVAEVVVAEVVAPPVLLEEIVAELVVAEAASPLAAAEALKEIVAEVIGVGVAAPRVSAPVPETRVRAASTTPSRRPRRARQSAPAMHATSNGPSLRFVVRYQAEAVLEAADIRDALRQATALGATDVVAITSEA